VVSAVAQTTLPVGNLVPLQRGALQLSTHEQQPFSCCSMCGVTISICCYVHVSEGIDDGF
jgi:hypothetical protein